MPGEVGEISAETVKAWLMRYQSIERTIDIQIERFEALETRLQSVSSPQLDGMPHGSPTRDRTGALLAQKEEIEIQIRDTIEAQTNRRHEIEKYVDHLQKADEKATILMRYIDGERWTDVSMMLFGSQKDFVDREDSYMRRVMKLHGRALQNLAEIMKEDCPADILQDCLTDNQIDTEGEVR
ncbi:MAG: hypothetical protein LUC98_05125 [Lachnospiraceae bacterium]|nr:hypothetical protein [Lachnospiraceae bacterium]